VPRYLIRDRDAAYGHAVRRRLQAMGIRDRPTAPRSLLQNAYAERLVGSIRRKCLDHIIVLGEAHLRHILKTYASYYNNARTHLSLKKMLPSPAPSSGPGVSLRYRSSVTCTISTAGHSFR
jgi:transposase InsO family protein